MKNKPKINPFKPGDKIVVIDNKDLNRAFDVGEEFVVKACSDDFVRIYNATRTSNRMAYYDSIHFKLSILGERKLKLKKLNKHLWWKTFSLWKI